MTNLVSLQALLAVFLWAALVVYGLSSLWWIVEVTVLSRGWEQNTEEVWDLNDIQVRVLTINAETVVQQTINALPEDITDVRVIKTAR